MVTIYINFVELESSMLKPRFRIKRLSVLKKRFRRRRSLKMVDNEDNNNNNDGIWIYYKLTHEPLAHVS